MDLFFEKLTKEYDGKRVLCIDNGMIKDGSITAVVGANGAGKSTLVNIIAGLDEPTSGRVRYGSVQKMNDALGFPRDEITLVFQKPYLISTTVEKNISYPMKLRGITAEERGAKVWVLAEGLGLASLLKQKTWKLSGGEIQKTALARALAAEPKLLLLDEPTANIDPATTAEIENMLVKMNREQGITIVIITHNLAQAKRICTDLIFLNKGRLIESGECAKVLSKPENELTGRFIAGELIT